MPKVLKKIQKTKLKTIAIKKILLPKNCQQKVQLESKKLKQLKVMKKRSKIKMMKAKKFRGKIKKRGNQRLKINLKITLNLVRENFLPATQLLESLITQVW